MVDTSQLRKEAANILLNGRKADPFEIIRNDLDAKLFSIIIQIAEDNQKSPKMRDIEQSELLRMANTTANMAVYRLARIAGYGFIRPIKSKRLNGVKWRVAPIEKFSQDIIDRTCELLREED